MKLFDKQYFMSPLSLGDAIVVNGIAHYFGDISVELHIPTHPFFYETIECLYHDFPHIKVVKISSIKEEIKYIKTNNLHHIKKPLIHEYTINNMIIPVWWDIQYYDTFDLTYSLKYSNFRLPQTIKNSYDLYQELSMNEPYALVHLKDFRHPDGYNVDIDRFRKQNNLPDIKIIDIKEGLTNNLLDYVDLIRNAEEIHCACSSVFNLVDCMFNQTKAKLYFHDIRKNSMIRVNSRWNNNCWTWVYYT
jgi:hypothetical protein